MHIYPTHAAGFEYYAHKLNALHSNNGPGISKMVDDENALQFHYEKCHEYCGNAAFSRMQCYSVGHRDRSCASRDAPSNVVPSSQEFNYLNGVEGYAHFKHEDAREDRTIQYLGQQDDCGPVRTLFSGPAPTAYHYSCGQGSPSGCPFPFGSVIPSHDCVHESDSGRGYPDNGSETLAMTSEALFYEHHPYPMSPGGDVEVSLSKSMISSAPAEYSIHGEQPPPFIQHRSYTLATAITPLAAEPVKFESAAKCEVQPPKHKPSPPPIDSLRPPKGYLASNSSSVPSTAPAPCRRGRPRKKPFSVPAQSPPPMDSLRPPEGYLASNSSSVPSTAPAPCRRGRPRKKPFSVPAQSPPPMDSLRPPEGHLVPSSSDGPPRHHREKKLMPASDARVCPVIYSYPQLPPRTSIIPDGLEAPHVFLNEVVMPNRENRPGQALFKLAVVALEKPVVRKTSTIACFFCRERKVACRPPVAGQRCKQCAKRRLVCEYPKESRRGRHSQRLPSDHIRELAEGESPGSSLISEIQDSSLEGTIDDIPATIIESSGTAAQLSLPLNNTWPTSTPPAVKTRSLSYCGYSQPSPVND